MGELVARSMREQYRRDGYSVLDAAPTGEGLERLGDGATYVVQKVDAELEQVGVDRTGINARGQQYFSAMRHRDRPELRKFRLCHQMAEVCAGAATLGPAMYISFRSRPFP